jgi:hypothetical protein
VQIVLCFPPLQTHVFRKKDGSHAAYLLPPTAYATAAIEQHPDCITHLLCSLLDNTTFVQMSYMVCYRQTILRKEYMRTSWLYVSWNQKILYGKW